MRKLPIANEERRASSAYEALRDLIVRGNLAPGVRLVEQDVAARLGISRTPAREAIQRLNQDGFLTALNSGPRTLFTVRPLTMDDMLDLYSIMASLEGSAARRTSRLPIPQRLSLARRMREANDRFVSHARRKSPDRDRQFELHNAFHDQLVAAAASPRLRALIDSVRPHVERYEYVYAPIVGPNHDATFAEHSSIIRAVREGSGAVAEAATRSNWMNSGDRLERAMSLAGPRGFW